MIPEFGQPEPPPGFAASERVAPSSAAADKAKANASLVREVLFMGLPPTGPARGTAEGRPHSHSLLSMCQSPAAARAGASPQRWECRRFGAGECIVLVSWGSRRQAIRLPAVCLSP